MRNGSEETVALLLTRGMAGSAADIEGVTALYLAARDDSKKFINLLIDNRVETVVKDNLRRILLHYCTRLNYNVATKLLVDRGSLLSAVDNSGRTARALAQVSIYTHTLPRSRF